MVLASKPVASVMRLAGWSAQPKVGAFRGEDAQNRFDDGGLADARTAGHDQHLGGQRKPDSGDLTFR